MRSYLNHALIGNKELRCGLTEKGEIIRIRYPNVDFREFIEFLHMGVKINDSNIIYLHEDPNNTYMQEYIEDTNILKTEIVNTYFNLKMEQIDFVSTNNNVIFRKYVFSNENEIDLDVKFLVHSKLLSDENEFVSGRLVENGLIQYSHGYNLGIVSDDAKVNGHKIHGADDAIGSGILYDKDYIGMSNNSAVSYDLGVFKPKEKKEFTIKIFVSENTNKIEELETKLEDISKLDVKKELQSVKSYWKKYLKAHMVHDLEDGDRYKQKIMNIYKRTILLYPLLTNYQTGGISAAMEIDEGFSKCRKIFVLLAKRFNIHNQGTRLFENGKRDREVL